MSEEKVCVNLPVLASTKNYIMNHMGHKTEDDFILFVTEAVNIGIDSILSDDAIKRACSLDEYWGSPIGILKDGSE